MARDDVTSWHQYLFHSEPSADQVCLYDQWPTFRGFSDRAKSDSRSDSVITLGLLTGELEDKVLLLAPSALHGWLLGRIERTAYLAMEHGKTEPGDVRARMSGFVKLFGRFLLNGRVLQMETEPANWVSYGFNRDDAVPEWLRRALL